MKLRTVLVEIIVCKDNETWYKDYEIIKTYYPDDPMLGQDALTKFGVRLKENETETEIEYMGVFDIRVAEPQNFMEDSCQDDDVTCQECPHFVACYQ